MASTIRIALIADADVYFQMAVSALLTHELGFSEVIEAHSFDEATEYLRERPEVSIVILNSSILGTRAAAGLRIVRECFPNTKVAARSGMISRRNIISFLESGVHGYLPNDLSIAELTAALRLVLNGGVYVPPCLAEVSPRLPEAVSEPPESCIAPDIATRDPLTPRQRDVLELLVQGMPNKDIASALQLGRGTVKIHIAAIFRHFGVSNRAAAAAACTRLGFGRARSHPPRPQIDGIPIHAK
ncbi:LuxR C-terminal-related transcriptional regulator [Microvirga sp. 2TAF3]|uniref:LuxR C-terminal-related transcriptional regulator n=1 Tax=Microvirga sp. 2TAF3 TaxID=3233014 RepID=UPI003F979381